MPAAVRAFAAIVLLMLTAAGMEAQCISSVRPISSRTLFPWFLSGAMAWNGNILGLAVPDLRDEEILLILYDQDGNELSDRQAIRTPREGLIDIIWNGVDFGVFYETEDGSLVLTRLGTSGEIVGPRTLAIPGFDLTAEDVDILWSPAEEAYVIGRTETNASERRIFVTLLRRNGAVVRSTQIAAAAIDSFVRLAMTDSGTIGILYEDRSASSVRLSLLGSTQIARSVWTPGNDVLVAGRGNEFAMFRRVAQGGASTIHWKIVDSSGQTVRDNALLQIGEGGDLEPVAVVARDNEYALSYFEWADGLGVGEPVYRLARVNSNGLRLSDTLFSPTGRFARERTDFGFVWTGTAYVSLGSDENGDDTYTLLIRACPLKTAISGARIVRIGTAANLFGSAEGGVPAYRFLWEWGAFNSSTDQNPSIVFDTLGDHVVTLTVTDANGTRVTQTFTVTIVQGPIDPPRPPRRRSVRPS